MGHLIPLFWTSGDISSGFQSQSGQTHLCLAEAYVLHIPWDSPLVWHLLTRGQHGSLVILFHIPASRHWWGLKPGPIVPLLTVWDQLGRHSTDWAMPVRLVKTVTLCLTQIVISFFSVCKGLTRWQCDYDTSSCKRWSHAQWTETRQIRVPRLSEEWLER